MPPRKRAAAGPPALTDADVSDLRFRVKSGDQPRVVVRTASAAVPAGTRGNVIRIGNPSDGEFIVVRLGRDEVPFAPSELGLSTRGRPPSAAATKAPAATKSAAKAAPAKAARAKRTSKATRPAAAGTPAKVTTKTATAKTAAKAAAAPAAPQPATGSAAPSRGRRAGGRTRGSGSRKGPQPLTVTLRFTDGGWSVEAQRGSRRIARASALRPGAVKAFAELVDDTTVRDAMTETVESCRAVVEERAEKLRAELEAAEAALREYEARRR